METDVNVLTKLPMSSELYEGGFNNFLLILNKWRPNDERENRNYERTLGALLARMGWDGATTTQDDFERLALASGVLFGDILAENDVQLLLLKLGHKKVGEFFLYLYEYFHNLFLKSLPAGVNGWLSPEKRKEYLHHWRLNSRENRRELFQISSEAAFANPQIPLEWVWALIDFQKYPLIDKK